MIIQFTENELQNLTIQPVPRRASSPAYLAERERAWSAQMEKVAARGGTMWNGEVYTLEEICSPDEGQLTLRMSTREYKDLMFRALQGPGDIPRRYGEDHRYHFTGVNCAPLTRDGKYVFGIRADRDVPTIGGIGGNLNKDEMEIHTFADIRQCMQREIEEETALLNPAADLRFFGLHAAADFYLFWFTLRLPVHSEEINDYCRPGEFSRLVAITLEEALAMTMPMTGAFRRWQPYLHLLPQVADGGSGGRL